jgi:hypothetical protein
MKSSYWWESFSDHWNFSFSQVLVAFEIDGVRPTDQTDIWPKNRKHDVILYSTVFFCWGSRTSLFVLYHLIARIIPFRLLFGQLTA